VELRGRVIKRLVARDSKSERDAVMLETDSGQYVLRRQGANPFADPVLEQLVGKSIAGEGVLQGYTFIMSRWREADPHS
jgi:hypothetical protein